MIKEWERTQVIGSCLAMSHAIVSSSSVLSIQQFRTLQPSGLPHPTWGHTLHCLFFIPQNVPLNQDRQVSYILLHPLFLLPRHFLLLALPTTAALPMRECHPQVTECCSLQVIHTDCQVRVFPCHTWSCQRLNLRPMASKAYLPPLSSCHSSKIQRNMPCEGALIYTLLQRNRKIQ